MRGSPAPTHTMETPAPADFHNTACIVTSSNSKYTYHKTLPQNNWWRDGAGDERGRGRRTYTGGDELRDVLQYYFNYLYDKIC